MKEQNIKELLKKAEKPSEDALKMHPYYRGKIQVSLKAPVRDISDFAIWYTPGVAAPCMEIKKNPLKVYEYTNKSNFVAIISDGTRVLGLGDIGPEAGLPVMEGKAMIFKFLGGVDAFPIMIKERDPDKFIDIVKALEPTFGGVNLEDISSPKCFYILERLREEMNIPVWHDDQQGTATVTLAALINALKIVGKEIDKVKVAMVGAGAANMSIERIIVRGGINPENILMVDSKGILNRDRTDIDNEKKKEKWHICETTNKENKRGGIPEALENADVLIALSKSGPDTIKKEWISRMNNDAVVFTCANPVPEIWPWDAKKAGATIVATGRSDFPNQVNNSLGFPAIFRGVLDVWAKTVTDNMCIAAAKSLAKTAEKRGLNDNYIIPTMEDTEAYIEEAVACGLEAIREGNARHILTENELRKSAKEKIKNSYNMTKLLMQKKIIPYYKG